MAMKIKDHVLVDRLDGTHTVTIVRPSQVLFIYQFLQFSTFHRFAKTDDLLLMPVDCITYFLARYCLRPGYSVF